MRSHLPANYIRSYFTTARVIHHKTDTTDELDWLWVNNSESWEFTNKDEAQQHADLSNENGSNSGLDVIEYPYFVVRITKVSQIEVV